jgi:hypothetical protein
MKDTVYLFLSILVISGCEKKNNDPIRAEADVVISNKYGNNRFSLISSPVLVIDSVTGQVWRLSGPVGGPYHFTRVCYLSSDGKSQMVTPYEEDLLPLGDEELMKHQKKMNQTKCIH